MFVLVKKHNGCKFVRSRRLGRVYCSNAPVGKSAALLNNKTVSSQRRPRMHTRNMRLDRNGVVYVFFAVFVSLGNEL